MQTKAYIKTLANETVLVSCAFIEDLKRFELMVFSYDEKQDRITDYDALEEHTYGSAEEALDGFEKAIEKWKQHQ